MCSALPTASGDSLSSTSSGSSSVLLSPQLDASLAAPVSVQEVPALRLEGGGGNGSGNGGAGDGGGGGGGDGKGDGDEEDKDKILTLSEVRFYQAFMMVIHIILYMTAD